jgi:hypothetical protein
MLAAGTSGQFLQSTGVGAPVWAAAGAEIVRVARTSNTALAAANKGNLIAITSGTFTQTFVAAATLGNGWFAYIQNSGTGDITLDPDGSETIDGLTSYIMYPSEVRLVQCDGAALRTIVLNAFNRTFTSSGTFTKPPGYSQFEGLMWSGGCGGTRVTSGGNAGGGGGCLPFVFLSSALSASETVTIGAGGAGSATTSPNIGGSSTFGGKTVTGGQSPNGGGSIPRSDDVWSCHQGFAGASANSGRAGRGSYGGGAGGFLNEGDYSAGGDSVYGGGGGGGGWDGITRAGGTSVFGGAGGQGGPSPQNGTVPGGGGGAGYFTTGGSGARGELRILGVI